MFQTISQFNLHMKKILLLAFLLLWMAGLILAQDAWQSSLLNVGTNGELTYHPDENGYVLPDFSHAGYKGGGIDMPDVPAVQEISPISGDNTAHIQDAINSIGLLPINDQGIRGALLLKAGTYDVYGTLYIKYDGVIVRGEGQGADPESSTIIFARGNSPNQRDVVLLGSATRVSGTSQLSNTKSFITDDIVPVGSFSFNVENSSLYEVGDRIIIFHPATQSWIESVDRGGVPFPDPSAPANPDERWVEGQLPIVIQSFYYSH